MNASVFDTEIEERDGDEVRYYGGCRICPKGTEVINPAFDIVPKELITGIITENGIIDPISVIILMKNFHKNMLFCSAYF